MYRMPSFTTDMLFFICLTYLKYLVRNILDMVGCIYVESVWNFSKGTVIMKMINYYDIMMAGYELLKEETEVIYGTDAKDQAESAIRMGGIVDMVFQLRKMCKEEKDN